MIGAAVRLLRRRPPAIGIRARLLLLVAAALLPLLVHDALELRRQADAERAGTRLTATIEARRIAARLESFLTETKTLVSALRLALPPERDDLAANDALLRRMKEEAPAYLNNLFLFDASGRNIGTSLAEIGDRTRVELGDRGFFLDLQRGRDISVGEVIRARGSGQWIFTTAVADRGRDGVFRGVLAGGVPLSRLHEAMISRDMPPRTVVRLVDQHGRIIGRSDDLDEWLLRDVGNDVAVQRHVKAGEMAEDAMWADGVARITGSVRMETGGWLVSVGIPLEHGAAAARDRFLRGFGAVLLATAAVAALAWVLSGWIARPLRLLAADADALASGNFGRRAELAGPIEMRRLGAAFNRMADALSDRIGEAERANAQLRQSDEFSKAVIDASPVAIIALDEQYRTVVWSRAAEQVFGYTAEEVLGKPSNRIPPGHEAAAEARLERVFRGEVLRDIEVLRRRKDGTLIRMRLAAAPVPDSEGRVRTAVFAFEDITQRRMLEERLHHTEKMEALGQLTGGLAHDFNNILGVIIADLEIVKGAIDPARPERQFAEDAVQAALRGAELNRSLLTFARRQPVQPRLVNVSRILDAAGGMLRRTLGERTILELSTSPGLWNVFIDPTQLETSLLNLAANARDAMPEGGRLMVTAKNVTLDESYFVGDPELRAGDYVAIEVSDTGCGMRPEILTRVFEPFFTTKEAGKGTGLGLSQVFGFARQSGGLVHIYSEPERGTTVRLYLPRAEGVAAGDAPPPKQRASRPLRRHPGPEVVLVVEDNEALRRGVARQLRSLGYDTLDAACAAEALQLLGEAQCHIDILFTDLVMPGIGGEELAAEATRLRPDLVVVFTSGFPDAVVKSLGRQPLPPNAVLLSKPYRKADLAEKLRLAKQLADA